MCGLFGWISKHILLLKRTSKWKKVSRSNFIAIFFTYSKTWEFRRKYVVRYQLTSFIPKSCIVNAFFVNVKVICNKIPKYKRIFLLEFDDFLLHILFSSFNYIFFFTWLTSFSIYVANLETNRWRNLRH